MLLVKSHESVELQKPTLPFRKEFFIINDFVNSQKALKPFFTISTSSSFCLSVHSFVDDQTAAFHHVGSFMFSELSALSMVSTGQFKAIKESRLVK